VNLLPSRAELFKNVLDLLLKKKYKYKIKIKAGKKTFLAYKVHLVAL